MTFLPPLVTMLLDVAIIIIPVQGAAQSKYDEKSKVPSTAPITARGESLNGRSVLDGECLERVLFFFFSS